METIKDKEFGGERPLFASKHLRLEGVTIHAGESALKECEDIEAVKCRFEGKYPFWHVDGFMIKDCLFTPGARAALWYSRNLIMTDTLVEAPKMFREMDNLKLVNVNIPDAQETLWHCRGVELENVSVKMPIICSCTARISVSQTTDKKETTHSNIAAMLRYPMLISNPRMHSGTLIM